MNEQDKKIVETLKEDEKFYEIWRKLNELETHIVNLIHPLQTLNKLHGPSHILDQFTRSFSGPIKIDSKELVQVMKDFKEDLDNYCNKMNLKALIGSFTGIYTIQHELKRVNEQLEELKDHHISMQKKINSIHENGFTVNVVASVEKVLPPVQAEEPKKNKKRR